MPSLDRFIQQPYRYFFWSRMMSRILWVNLLDLQGWLVTGYDEAEAIMKDPRFVKERHKLIPPEQIPAIPAHIQPAYELSQHMLVFRDAPDHTRMRSIVTKVFTRKMVEKLRPAIEQMCDDTILSRKGHKQHELIGDIAFPFTFLTIAVVLGVPRADMHKFRDWFKHAFRVVDLNSSMRDWEELTPMLLSMREYLDALIDEKQARPQDDLISGMLAVQEHGEKMSRVEMISTCLLLLFAGHETTYNLITNGYYLLLRHPKQMKLLQSNPALIGNAIDEILRYEPPGLLTTRWVSEDMQFAGKTMKKSQIVIIALGGANRDPRKNKRPGKFDITRKQIQHLSFTAGAHYCLGTALGKMEAEIALSRLLKHFHDPVVIEKPKWKQTVAIHGVESLKLEAEIR
ncbi:MAG: cytochrome P450 [Paenibacillaceae bacterium]|nr:cytochrome P450 [Paenibacillaceae bacterium]